MPQLSLPTSCGRAELLGLGLLLGHHVDPLVGQVPFAHDQVVALGLVVAEVGEHPLDHVRGPGPERVAGAVFKNVYELQT